jgi:hypothetical protein
MNRSIKNSLKVGFFATLMIAGVSSCSDAQMKQITKTAGDLGKVLNTGNPLTNDEVVKGLKEALTQGITKASGSASAVGGFAKNPLLFIPFPPEAKEIETKLRSIGLGNLCDQFTESLNHGAELAAGKAVPIFAGAITNMSIGDGFEILKGNKDAATRYLETNTSSKLFAAFKPVIETALGQSNATKYWGDIISAYNKIPFIKKMNPDLASFATTKSIEGLFKLIQGEESNIRQNASARTSDLLKRVFGQQP